MANDLRQRWTEAAMRFCAVVAALPTCKSEIFILNRHPEEPA